MLLHFYKCYNNGSHLILPKTIIIAGIYVEPSAFEMSKDLHTFYLEIMFMTKGTEQYSQFSVFYKKINFYLTYIQV